MKSLSPNTKRKTRCRFKQIKSKTRHADKQRVNMLTWRLYHLLLTIPRDIENTSEGGGSSVTQGITVSLLSYIMHYVEFSSKSNYFLANLLLEASQMWFDSFQYK